MKKLLVITLFFFNIGSFAADEYRCKYSSFLEDDEFKFTKVVAFANLKIDEGWFTSEVTYQTKVFKNAIFGENVIHWGTDTDKSGSENSRLKFDKFQLQYEFDRESLELIIYKNFQESQKSIFFKNHSYKYLEFRYSCKKY